MKTDRLKKYILEKENAYLLDDNNNGKIIMLSGAWGSGKTHFWQHEIEPELKNKLNEKACVYVSLYGKESLSDIKSDVYLSANGKNILSTEVSTFGIEALSAIKDSDLAIGKVAKAGKVLFDNKKMQKGIAKLKKGGIICFDDFERKSKNVDLNDLFGFISQLAINLECKVVIILNSNVFKDKEAEIFSRVKEKTISKYFEFNPSFEELFNSIASNQKYDELNEYKKNILSAIKETEELNARIYIQVLDNCLEWLEVKKNIDSNIIRVLVLSTCNFVLNHLILDYQTIKNDSKSTVQKTLFYREIIKFSDNIQQFFHVRFTNSTSIITGKDAGYNHDKPNLTFLEQLSIYLGKKGTNKDKEDFTWFLSNKSAVHAVYKYGYELYYVGIVTEKQYKEISSFIKTGILLP